MSCCPARTRQFAKPTDIFLYPRFTLSTGRGRGSPPHIPSANLLTASETSRNSLGTHVVDELLCWSVIRMPRLHNRYYVSCVYADYEFTSDRRRDAYCCFFLVSAI